jgi:hypothetical protein
MGGGGREQPHLGRLIVVINPFLSGHLNFFLRILDISSFPLSQGASSWRYGTGHPSLASEVDRRDGINRRTQWFKLVVGVNLVGFRRRMASELLPDFLRDAGVGHYAIK